MVLVVLLAWGYVVLLMALATAGAADGGIGAALRVALGYGLLPMALFVYIAGSPLRRKAARRAAQAQAAADPTSGAPNASGHATAGAEPGRVAPVREKDRRL
ncbi:hypothetical protein Talka_00889 [Tepidimonas alkaliphilus]|uniref:Transmembrane protein n=1 Tax=Tepidimonas alkaliphilus TaxID=2588942 RepID=A0A554WAF4_9BURK|nr:hypothetical protein [Tepidimonas alkaliphilus]TSE20542.1 hypothetical protein Talka_00889 [Tepidimonas alkaliphilus]